MEKIRYELQTHLTIQPDFQPPHNFRALTPIEILLRIEILRREYLKLRRQYLEIPPESDSFRNTVMRSELMKRIQQICECTSLLNDPCLYIETDKIHKSDDASYAELFSI
ncbi:hypothetical protein GJ496_009393 [Pomphorhynchus laevis]|nr:hypothetical protein GJ496_009393 [Pomphorhynchus laevis]